MLLANNVYSSKLLNFLYINYNMHTLSFYVYLMAAYTTTDTLWMIAIHNSGVNI